MPIVTVLKPLGFEQVGDVVDYRGADVDQKIANGELALYTGEPVAEPVVEEAPAAQEAPVVESTLTEEPAKAEGLLQKIEEEIKEVVQEVEGK